MKQKAYILLGVLLLLFGGIEAQVITETNLENCRQQAVENYPLSLQYQMLEESSQLKVENLNSNYLPQLSINGQATYQSDVTKVPLDLPPGFNISIPEPTKDQYKLTVDLSQVIYDGGMTAEQKALQELYLQTEKTSLDIQLYALKVKVNRLYFGIILLKKNHELLQVLHENIASKLQNILAAAEHGAALQMDVNKLKAEVLKLEQQIEKLETSLTSNLKNLSTLTGEEYSIQTKFNIPEVEMDLQYSSNRRLEYQLLQLKQQKIDQSQRLVSSKSIPKIYGFGAAGYGQPGLNMLSDEFDSFYMIGIKLNWSPWNWNKYKKEKSILGLQNNILETQKDAFDLNLQIELENRLSEINQFENMLIKDNRIVKLKSEIAQTSSSQFDHGVITSTDYLMDVNAETEAKLNQEIHKIQLIKAKIDYQTSKGDI